MAADIDLENFKAELERLQQRFGVTDTTLSTFVKSLNKEIKDIKDFEKAIKDLNKNIVKGNRGYQDQLNMIDQLTDAIEELANSTEDTVDSEEKNTKIRTMLAQREKLVREAAMQNLSEQFEKFGETLTKTGVATSASFIKELQTGASATKLASGVLSAGIDIASQAGQGFGSALSSAGAALMSMQTGITQVLGALAIVGGQIIESGSKIAAGLAKFGVDVMSAEVEKTTKAFVDISNAGAMFADGMTGMRKAAGQSMLSLQDFAAVVARQANNLGATGLSVPVATKRLGDALAKGGDFMRTRLMNLGFRIEEHGDLVGETMSLMSQYGRPLRADEAAIAAATEKYAENLRVIAAVTGQDAKKKMEQAREDANQLMFQQKLARLEPEQRKAVIEGMATMGKQERKNFMDMVNFGTVINRQGNIAMAAAPALKQKIDATFALYEQGQMNAQSTLAAGQQFNREIEQQIYSGEMATGLAAAQAVGATGDVATAGETLLGIVQELPSPEAIEAGRQSTLAQNETTDALTKDLNSAQMAANKLAIELESRLLPLLGRYSDITSAMLVEFEKYLKKVGVDLADVTSEKDRAQSADQYNAALAKEQEIYQKEGVGILRQFFGVFLSDEAQAARDERIAQQRRREDVDKEFRGEYATGGVADGPTSGYPVKLHGTEAVVPLPDGENIPVKMGDNVIEAITNSQKNRPDIQQEMRSMFPSLIRTAMDAHAAMMGESRFSGNQSLYNYMLNQSMDYGLGEVAPGLNPYTGYRMGMMKIGDIRGAANRGLIDIGTGLMGDSSIGGARKFFETMMGSYLSMDFGTAKVSVERLSDSLDEMTAMVTGPMDEEGRTFEFREKIKLSNISNDMQGLLKVFEELTKMDMMAEGGIADRPSIVGEAGSEAVVPLTKNRSIPVTLDSNTLVSTMQQQSGLLAQILRAMEKNNSISSGILQVST